MRSTHLAGCIAAIAAFGGSVALSQAAVKTWTGASASTPTAWADSTNWSGGAPAVNDYQDIARFTENSPVNKTPAGATQVNKLFFDNSVNWTVTASEITLKDVESTGVGINTVSGTLKMVNGSRIWNIGTGNTLAVTTLITDGSGSQLKIQGGGTLQLTNQVSYSFSNNKDIVLSGATLRVAKSTVFNEATSQTHIATLDASLILQTTVAGATGQIGTKIIDDYGAGLIVTDIGGGFVQIAVPEPASLTALSLAGLGLLRRRRA